MKDIENRIKNRPELPWDDSCGDHIRILDGMFDDNICNACIDKFDLLEEKGLTTSRRDHGLHNIMQSDQSIFYSTCDATIHHEMQDVNRFIMDEIIESWQIKYPLIDTGTYSGLCQSHLKMQKTRPSEGYHQWHAEAGSNQYDRQTVLAWMLYLNDIDEGGETEFLYQGVRVQPKMGRFVCWPGGWTHIHRGNPPLNDIKYAITGWINYVL